MRSVFFILIVVFSFSLCAKEVGVLYYTNIFGHLHDTAERTSSSLTTLSCGFPVTILTKKNYGPDKDWTYAKVGLSKGYIESKYLASKRTTCFQEKYPRFLSRTNLDITEMYYWGRLYDQYIEGESKVP